MGVSSYVSLDLPVNVVDVRQASRFIIPAIIDPTTTALSISSRATFTASRRTVAETVVDYVLRGAGRR